MGIPKYYKWICETYPESITEITSNNIPHFDNLYLDMNGIIHPCSRKGAKNKKFKMSEEKIFINIYAYIEFMVRTVRPQKLLFIAVDGVAPRAKMNEQRMRRFTSARQADNKAARKEMEEQNGGEIPLNGGGVAEDLISVLGKNATTNIKTTPETSKNTPKRPQNTQNTQHSQNYSNSTEFKFDTTSITPGTSFMQRLDIALRYYIKKRISQDRNGLWDNLEVIYSGHQTPGEGEHKIADFIRYSRSRNGYDGKMKHCFNGLDADLIHLALCSHETNIYLLREEDVHTRKNSEKLSTFHLVDIHVVV